VGSSLADRQHRHAALQTASHTRPRVPAAEAEDLQTHTGQGGPSGVGAPGHRNGDVSTVGRLLLSSVDNSTSIRALRQAPWHLALVSPPLAKRATSPHVVKSPLPSSPPGFTLWVLLRQQAERERGGEGSRAGGGGAPMSSRLRGGGRPHVI
jgi:hypothetical protein